MAPQRLRTNRLVIHSITGQHLRFLLRLWNDVEVMRYAGSARDWSYGRMKEWYERYQQRIARFGTTETQFVCRLKQGKLIGESGLGRLSASWGCRHYRTPKGKMAVMADVKLLRLFWNQGYGTEAMRAVVEYVFRRTDADLFLVPPHRDNPAAVRVYQKVGFRKTEGSYYRRHIIYEMTKQEFDRRFTDTKT